MQKRISYQIVATALLITIGLILPYFTSHAFGIPGTILLPMHIPVLLCGLLCGPRFGVISGIIIPLLSSFLTGMPALYPMLPIIAVQLCAMGLVSGLLYQSYKRRIHLSILCAMLSGWVAYGLAFAALMFASDGTLRALSVSAAVVQGIPGIIVHLILIPIFIAELNRYHIGQEKTKYTAELTPDMEAVNMIKEGKASCVVIKGKTIIHTADGRGVSPLMQLYREKPEKLENAYVVDKIIGKAAAMILVLCGTKKVYGEIMSAAGLAFLQEHEIETGYGRCVDALSAREGSGICPIEKSVLSVDDPIEGIIRISDTINVLMNRAG